MNVEKTALHGVLILTPRVFEDPRGFFQETYTQKIFQEIGIKDQFLQDNHSYSVHKGTLRGLHFQSGDMAQSKLIKVIKGSVLDIVVDIDPKSPTFKKSIKLVLTDKSHSQIYIPRGYAHGFCTLEPDTHVIYKVDNYYSGVHNSGIIWNDPDLAIDWDCSEPFLSEQDKKWPKLRDILK